MTRKIYFISSLGLIIIVGLVLSLRSRETANASREYVVRAGTIYEYVSASGRTEGVSEEIKVASKLPGRIQRVLVQEGTSVRKGDVIAVLENEELKSRVQMAKASLEKAHAHLELIQNGARREEREASRAAVVEAEAIADNARKSHQRVKKLFEDGGVMAREQADQAERDLKTSEAKLESARQRYQLITAAARPEEIRSARAEIDLAKAQLDEARVNFENAFIRAPLSGIVLKQYLKPGETIAYESLAMPIITMADNSKMRVRAEVDETNFNKVKLGQKALVTAKAFSSHSFAGRVIRFSGGIGKKTIKTDNPLDKVDTEILETLVELEPEGASKLKLGLRVDVVIYVEGKDHVLLVPVPAVRKKGSDSYVKLKKQSDAVEQKVQVGLKDHENIEIVEGLRPNDVVVY